MGWGGVGGVVSEERELVREVVWEGFLGGEDAAGDRGRGGGHSPCWGWGG